MKKLQRIDAIDTRAIREKLRMAFYMLEPREQTQRREFKKMMLDLYLLRVVDHYTFKQLTNLLVDLGLKLSESTVRDYYSTFVVEMREELDSKISEHIAFREEIRKATTGLDLSEIPKVIQEISQRIASSQTAY